MTEKSILRARDFWTSLVLIGVSAFFIFRTTYIPFLNTKVAGVDAADWYNSAALVPYGVFGSMLVLSIVLLWISITEGGARHALSSCGVGYSRPEAIRLVSISVILFFYIFGLVPRVDFIIASSLMITCLIWGFHRYDARAMLVCTGTMVCTALYATVVHFDRNQWAKPHDDDWVALTAFIGLTVWMLVAAKRKGRIDTVTRLTPVIAVLVPALLVMAMAFGFRQNVPNRTGLLFSKIEYHYYVTLKPMLKGSK